MAKSRLYFGTSSHISNSGLKPHSTLTFSFPCRPLLSHVAFPGLEVQFSARRSLAPAQPVPSRRQRLEGLHDELCEELAKLGRRDYFRPAGLGGALKGDDEGWWICTHAVGQGVDGMVRKGILIPVVCGRGSGRIALMLEPGPQSGRYNRGRVPIIGPRTMPFQICSCNDSGRGHAKPANAGSAFAPPRRASRSPHLLATPQNVSDLTLLP